LALKTIDGKYAYLMVLLFSNSDYREILRKHIPGPAFFVFNVVFISLAQSILLFLITTPTYVLLLAARFGEKMDTADLMFSRALMGLVLLEFFADQQQWSKCSSASGYFDYLESPISEPFNHVQHASAGQTNKHVDFQNAKKSYQKEAKVPHKFEQEDLDRGFVVTGLWSWVRHPNFAAEQAIWVVLYQWGCWTTHVLYNWTFIGAIAYLFLFQASTWFTELITAQKYPEYKEYQQRVGRFLPRLTTDLPGDFSDQKARPKVEKAPTVQNTPAPKKGAVTR
jgi:steroid 5-alpha reductase family enzyme